MALAEYDEMEFYLKPPKVRLTRLCSFSFVFVCVQKKGGAKMSEAKEKEHKRKDSSKTNDTAKDSKDKEKDKETADEVCSVVLCSVNSVLLQKRDREEAWAWNKDDLDNFFVICNKPEYREKLKLASSFGYKAHTRMFLWPAIVADFIS